jgi:oligopeptide transport system permease protein
MPEPEFGATRRTQEYFVAPPETVEVLAVDRLAEESVPTSIWRDAWHRLRRNPVFIVAVLLILLVLLVVAWPQLFTSQDPRYCDTALSMAPHRAGHPFGFDQQGCDVYTRTLYGARASVACGVGAAVLFVLVGGVLGALAGFYGGVLDAVVSRVAEIFYALPLVLAAIVLMQLLSSRTVLTVILILVAFTWPQAARIARGAVIQAKNSEYVTAARALGVSLGVFIVTEATLSYLGVGLPHTIVSWGADIAADQEQIRTSGILFYPATALALTVLSFILLGDAVRDALDPTARTR